MVDDNKKPEKIRISPAAAKKLRKATGGKIPEGQAGDGILQAIIKKLKGE